VSDNPEEAPPTEEEESIELEEVGDPLVEMQEKIDFLEKEIQYSAAEIVNVRQRAIRDRNELSKYGGSSLATRLLPMIDNLTRAINTSSNEKAASESLIEGIKLTLEGMINSLRLEGVMKIEIEKGQFDPSCMESIASIPCPEGKNPGDIIEVIEEGYKLHGRVLRPTKVIVSEG
jgi:molecular chaperone GrpE|tara:strand:- start:431 stop:955 length:525 start_codon:yes stop_codon:yes gene_type:complete